MLHVALALLSVGTTPESPPPAFTVGSIQYDERVWGRGSLPTLTFNASSGRGQPEKVLAYLYYSDEPQAFETTTFPPQFVGAFTVPFSTQVVTDRPPERGPITELSREKFVQGALFDQATGALVDVTNEEYLDIAYSAAPTIYAFDFTTEDDFTTLLVNGQDVATPPEFGVLASLSTRQPPTGPHHQGAAIFDSDPAGPNAASSDPDLLVDLGNVLMLQENPGQTVPGIFDVPDDAANGGVIVLDFTGFDYIEKVEPRAIDLIDIDSAGTGAKVFLVDVLGQSRFYTVPAGWTEDIAAQGGAGYRTLDLTTLLPQPGFASTATASGDPEFLPGEVVRMEVTLLGSGALDNVVFANEQDPGALRSRGRHGAVRSGVDGTRTR